MKDIHLLRYKKVFDEINTHIQRLEYAFNRLKNLGYLPLDADKVKIILKSEELIPLLDQISYRYSKLQDSLGKLIRSYLYIKGENVENLPILDVINLAEKFGIDINAEKWFKLRELRNLLVHEYEDQYTKISDVLNQTYKELGYIKNLVKQLKVG